MRKNEQGFGVVEILMIIVIIGLMIAVGWLFFDRQGNKQTDNTTTTNQPQQTQEESKKDEKAQTGSVAKVLSYTLDDAVNDINKTLSSESCRGGGTGQVVKSDFKVVDDSAQFNYQGGKSIISNDFTYAYTQYGCGTQGSVGILKKIGDNWRLVSEDAMIYPMCAKVRGHGFPASVIDKCFADENAIDPVKL